MQEEPRITDHEPVIAAAHEDAGRQGARFVHMTVGELWRLIHRGPRLPASEADEMPAGLLHR